jgi:hypothetical protein
MTPSERKSNIENISDFFEPCFYLGLNKDRKLPTGIDTAHTLNSFEYRLKQDPNDLSCHLQRMQFSITVKNRIELFAAICDLFIVLGDQGLALRKRLLDTCRKVLNQEQLALIEAHLNDEPLSTYCESLPDNCFFKKEALEYTEQEKHSNAMTETDEDVLRIAESYITNSQFDTALEYMQTHLEQDQNNKALALKLISLYRALNRADKFHSAFEKFSNNVATSLYWSDAKKHFSNQ